MIRMFNEHDLRSIVAIGRDVFREAGQVEHKMYGEERWHLIPKKRDEEIGDFIAQATEWHCAQSPDTVYICEVDDKVVGYMLVEIHRQQNYGEIGINALVLEYRGRGLGQEMYRAAIERFRNEGLRYAVVDTGLIPEDNPARRAYERAGFQVLSGEVRYYREL